MRCEAANVKHICHTAIVSASPPVFEPPRPYDCDSDVKIHRTLELTPSKCAHSDATSPQIFRNSSRSRARSAPAKELETEPRNDNALGVPGASKSERKVSSIRPKIITKVKDKNEEKRLNKRKRKYSKSHLVYYVQTETKSPFNQLNEPLNSEQSTYYNRKNYHLPVGLDDDYSMYNNCDMNERYVATMVRKQYEHYPMGADLSDTSDFSTPVCRDPPHDGGPAHYESDICSCCHGPFHNVDDSMRLPQHSNMWEATPQPGMCQYMQQQITENSAFYDSSLYDIVPVKEMPTKQRRDENAYVNQESKRFATHVCPRKAKRAKPRKQHNYHNVAPLRVIPRYVYVQRKKNNSKVIPQRKDSLGKLGHLRKTGWIRTDTQRQSEISAVDCSQIYSRPICIANVTNKAHIQSTPAKVPIEVKNVECLATSVNNSECQTASTKSVQLEAFAIDENKTEVTLNQIKTILQSVLTEVKTSTQMKSLPECIPKKDAVVQKDQSQNNMQSAVAATSKVQPVQNAVSSFMNYSYSPYNLRPYGPSCSRQVPSSHLAPPLSPFQPKCMHNYPLFIQTTGRQCACCFRSIPKGVNTAGSNIVSNAPPQAIHHSPPATIATNTEQVSSGDKHLCSRSPETDKLIQEIYKSIAVNMDYFTKNSTSDYNDLKSSNPSQNATEIGLPSMNERKKQVGLAMVHRSKVSSSDHCKSMTSPALVSKMTLSNPRHSHRTQSLIKESAENMRRELPSARRRGGLLVHSSSSLSDSSTTTSNESESEQTIAEVRFVDQVCN